MAERTVHHGRNIKRIREIQGIKQEALALELGDDWNQKKISLLEAKETIDDALLVQVAGALKTTPEAIKKFSEEAANNYFNTFNDNSINNGAVYAFNSVFNPLERWLEAMDENKKLYERLLQSERKKVELLEKVLELKK